MKNHKAYVQSWAECIQKDENELISAIFDAEKIADYIETKADLDIVLGKTDKVEIKEEVQPKFSTGKNKKEKIENKESFKEKELI